MEIINLRELYLCKYDIEDLEEETGMDGHYRVVGYRRIPKVWYYVCMLVRLLKFGPGASEISMGRRTVKGQNVGTGQNGQKVFRRAVRRGNQRGSKYSGGHW